MRTARADGTADGDASCSSNGATVAAERVDGEEAWRECLAATAAASRGRVGVRINKLVHSASTVCPTV